ncbi:hypothetical protein GGI15_000015 [Coemansia interrupta]|uniref:Rho-GAP domain-containing protein n=1 Tax=Coemansia interrupta TaxID=1126814 RepID=A0A9W8LMP3_9FUNG|nr:hypothetical protein GGI15_000015 [Coemansia interrupta]
MDTQEQTNNLNPAAQAPTALSTAAETVAASTTKGTSGDEAGLTEPVSAASTTYPLSPQHRVSNPTKEAWILHSLKNRRTEFLSSKQINVFIGTWNVNGKSVANSNELSEWLGFVPKDDSQVGYEKLPELVILGFQELDARAEAFVYNNAAKDNEWTDAIEQGMGNARYSYSKLASKQLIGMFVMVYCRIDVLGHVSGVQATSVGCGIMGMVGNKGAVAVRMVYMDTPMCFVCSHLAHDAAQVDRRNAQFHDLCRRLSFGLQDGDGETSPAASTAAAADPLLPKGSVVGSGQATAGRPLTVFDHSYLLWFGDLNYRLAIDTGDMSDFIQRGEYASLLGLDQLRIAMMNKQAFEGFEEADIAFAPTYKYILGTHDYDPKRRPAWCDRVLWWTRPGCEDGIRSVEYTAVNSLVTSDHKPVRSQLSVDVWKVDTERRQAVYIDVLRVLDRYENECIPTATLESTVVELGDVSFGCAVRRQMRLSNAGQVPLEYSFIATPSREGYAPAWLRITPDCGMLLPGQNILLEFVVLVDRDTSAALSVGLEELSDILVLHLTRGRDYFIQVQGRYVPSVFGMSLDYLVHCKKSVREMSREDFDQCLLSGQFSVPKCIWSLIDFLSQYGVDRGYSLFYWPGDRALAKKIRELLDRDVPLDPEGILQWHADSETLVARTVVEEQSPRLRALAVQQIQQQQQQDHSHPSGTVSDSSHMSLIDQTLVSSTLNTGFNNMNLYSDNVAAASASAAQNTGAIGRASGYGPSTAEALEHLSLGNIGESSLTNDSGTNSNSDSETDAASVGHTLLPGNSRSIAGGNSLLLSTAEGLAGSPLPEAIGNIALSAPHDAGVDTVANSLVELLQSLPEPLIPSDLYSACIEAGGVSRAATLEALEVLPPGNLNVLVYLLAFLREAIERGATSAQRVAQVFSRVLLRPPMYDLGPHDYERAESFLQFLLRSHGNL